MKVYFLTHERMVEALKRLSRLGVTPKSVEVEHDDECEPKQCSCAPWHVIDLAKDSDLRRLS